LSYINAFISKFNIKLLKSILADPVVNILSSKTAKKSTAIDLINLAELALLLVQCVHSRTRCRVNLR